jgi:hypothetical protein
VVALGELGAQCPLYPAKGAPNDEFFNWFKEEVSSLPEVFTHLNKNVVALALEGMLKMLHGSGCNHLPTLQSLATSSEWSFGVGRCSGGSA